MVDGYCEMSMTLSQEGALADSELGDSARTESLQVRYHIESTPFRCFTFHAVDHVSMSSNKAWIWASPYNILYFAMDTYGERLLQRLRLSMSTRSAYPQRLVLIAVSTSMILYRTSQAVSGATKACTRPWKRYQTDTLSISSIIGFRTLNMALE